MKYMLLCTGILFVLACVGCTQQQAAQPAADSHSSTTASSTSTQVRQSSWHVQDPEINPLDGAKTQFLSTGSLEGKLEEHYISGLGSLPNYKSTAKIVLCFENGKLCSSRSIGARIDVDGFVSSDSGSVRLKYDDGQPIRQRWSASDSHNSLFPYGREKQFLAALLGHKQLYFEFSKYEEAEQVVTFDVAGLADAMKNAGLKVPQPEQVPHASIQ